MTDVAKQKLATASAVIKVMAEVTPEINNLLETNMITISDSFTKIAESGRNLTKMVDELDENNPMAAQLKSEISNVNQCVANAIIGMQFQDRLSQNLVILKDISNKLNDKISSDIQGAQGADIEAAKEILELIKLGEIRKIYFDYLIEKGLIESPDDLEYNEFEESSSNNAAIELF